MHPSQINSEELEIGVRQQYDYAKTEKEESERREFTKSFDQGHF